MSSTPPEAEPTASGSSPNILTLRIYHEKTSFTATFRTRFTAGSTPETKCSCSRIRHVWVGADDTPRNPTLLGNVPHNTTIVTFIFRSASHTERARSICAISQQLSDDIGPFRKRMEALMRVLENLCEAEHLPDRPETRSASGFVRLLPFRTSDLDTKAVSEELRTKIMTPLATSEVQGRGMGYVYIIRSVVDMGFASVLKIGFSKYHPEHRAHELASCLSIPEVVAHTPLIPHAKRIEALIHAELVAQRKVVACDQCGQDHKEWFTISHAESREIVIRWSRWVLQQPYINGKLSDEWQAYLQGQDFGSSGPEETMADLWTGILDNHPRQNATSTPEEQLGAYLNTCYLESLVQRSHGPLKEGELKFNPEELGLGDIWDTNRPLEPRDFEKIRERIIDMASEIESDPAIGAQSRGSSSHGVFERPVHDLNAWKRQLEELKAIQDLKTGARTVSDTQQGVTESPMGDATLLPVLSLKAVKQMHAPARNWIGYNPTHEGFQYLQEAYQRGEWKGQLPQFKLPKLYRMAEAQGPDPPEGVKANGRRMAKLTETEDSDIWEFSVPMDDKFEKQMKEMQELMKFPLGRALLEREAQRAMRHIGIHSAPWEGDNASTDSESSGEGEGMDKMDVDEPEHPQPRPAKRARVEKDISPANVSTSNLPDGLGVSKAGAKRWLESM